MDNEIWYRRDLPVLRGITRAVDAGQTVSAESIPWIARETGLTVDEVELAVHALLGHGALRDERHEPTVEGFGMLEVTGEAYLLVGLHPDRVPEHRERVVMALDQLAGRLSPEDAATVRGISGQLRGLSRDALAAFIAAVAAGHVIT